MNNYNNGAAYSVRTTHHTISIDTRDIKSGSYMMIEGRPCKVRSNSHCPHRGFRWTYYSWGRYYTVGVDVSNGKTHSTMNDFYAKVAVPFLHRSESIIADIEEEQLDLVSEAGDWRSDLGLPEHMADQFLEH